MTPKRYSVLVVEDEPLARADLVHLLRMHPDLEVSWQASNVDEAKAVLATESPDILFLDVLLGEGNGFDVVPYAPPSAEIVFVTAHDEHAVRAFEVNALDYLTKPVSPERLAESVRRVKRASGSSQKGTQSLVPSDQVFVRDGSKRCFVSLRDLLVLSSEGGNYTTLLLRSGESFTVRATLKGWEERLPGETFVRVHRTTIINLLEIRQLWKETGAVYIELSGIVDPIRVSRSRVSRVKRLLERHSLGLQDDK